MHDRRRRPPTTGAAQQALRRIAERGRQLLPATAAAFLTDTPVFLLAEQINLQPKHRVLVVEPPTGGIAVFLNERIAFPTAPVTIAPPRSPTTGEAGVDVRPAGALPVADASFDLIVAPHVFHRLEDGDLYRFLREAYRALRPGGVLVGWDYASRSSRVLNEIHTRLLTRDGRPAHLRGFGPLVAYATEVGFARIERPLLPPFLFPPVPRTAILAQKGSGLLQLGDATLR